MPPESALDRAVEAVADGMPVDWDVLESGSRSEGDRQWLRCLRILHDVASLHRGEPNAAEATREGSGGARPGATVTRSSDASTQWGRYRLTEKVGQGSFGSVYRAWDPQLEREVAIKILHQHVADTRLRERLLHEGRALARVRHPNVVSVLGVEEHEGRVGLCMEFVRGETLDSVLQRHGTLNAREAALIGEDLCQALSAVHRAGFVHRDVKARNVMREEAGRIVLMDFGTGRAANQPDIPGDLAGTPLYMAPEILEGEPASACSDIYSLGVLLFHLVTGEYPVRAGSLNELAEAHAARRRHRLAERRPDLPRSFVRVAERALAHEPSERYQSAAALLEALDTGLALQERVPAGEESLGLQRAMHLALSVVGVFLAVGLLGFVANRLFERVLEIDPDFAAGPADHVTVGVEALFPFAVYWVVGGVVAGAAAGLLRLLAWSHLETTRARWAGWTRSLDPIAVSLAVFLAGVTCWVAITWAFFDIFAAIGALGGAAPDSAVDVSSLSPSAREAHLALGGYAAVLSFVLGVVAWLGLPRLESQTDNPSIVRLVRWAMLVLAFLVVTTAAMPRHFIWESFEIVTFDGRPAVVIGSSNEELLLYAPDVDGRPRWRVSKDATGLERTGRTARLFDRHSSGR
jgi:hypothetical protein